MPIFNFRVVHKQYYDVTIEAETEVEAEQKFEDGQGEYYSDGPEFDGWEILDIENLSEEEEERV